MNIFLVVRRVITVSFVLVLGTMILNFVFLEQNFMSSKIRVLVSTESPELPTSEAPKVVEADLVYALEGFGSVEDDTITKFVTNSLPLPLGNSKKFEPKKEYFEEALPYLTEKLEKENLPRTRKSIYTHELLNYGKPFVHYNFTHNPFTARCKEGAVTVFKGPMMLGRCASLISKDFVYAVNDFPHCKPGPSYCYDLYNQYFKTPLDTGVNLNQPLDVVDMFLPQHNMTVITAKKIVPIMFMWGSVFPHTIKDTMPRVAMALPYLAANPEAKILIEFSSFSQNFMKRMGIPDSRILWLNEGTWHPQSLWRENQSTLYVATEEIALPHCHPGPHGTGIYASEVYHAMRDLLIHEPHLPESERNLILYVARDGGSNYEKKGFMRRLDNEAEVLKKLNETLQALEESGIYQALNLTAPVFLRFKGNGMAFEDQIELFKRARVVFGPHGGGFYNLIFAAPKTRVIELTPDDYGKFEVARLSTVLGLEYHGYIKQGMLRNETFGDIDADWLVSKVLHHYQPELVNLPASIPPAYKKIDRLELAASSNPF